MLAQAPAGSDKIFFSDPGKSSSFPPGWGKVASPRIGIFTVKTVTEFSVWNLGY